MSSVPDSTAGKDWSWLKIQVSIRLMLAVLEHRSQGKALRSSSLLRKANCVWKGARNLQKSMWDSSAAVLHHRALVPASNGVTILMQQKPLFKSQLQWEDKAFQISDCRAQLMRLPKAGAGEKCPCLPKVCTKQGNILPRQGAVGSKGTNWQQQGESMASL